MDGIYFGSVSSFTSYTITPSGGIAFSGTNPLTLELSMTTGTATIDFGSFPGTSDASVAVTGQINITSTSFVEAWISPKDTADHTADEHWVETIRVIASAPTAGVGFTIYAINTNTLHEPLTASGIKRNHLSSGTAAANTGYGHSSTSVGGSGTMLYGKFNVSWVWV